MNLSLLKNMLHENYLNKKYRKNIWGNKKKREREIIKNYTEKLRLEKSE